MLGSKKGSISEDKQTRVPTKGSDPNKGDGFQKNTDRCFPMMLARRGDEYSSFFGTIRA
jgi:hypothetical protein